MTIYGRFDFDFIPTPYTDANMRRPATAAKRTARMKYRHHSIKTRTAKQVAGALELRYEILDHFYDKYEDYIEELTEQIMEEEVENIFETGSRRSTAFENLAKPILPEITRLFHQFLDNREMDRLVEGVPTYASIMGRSARGKKYSRPGRPSFVDTGIYKAAFKVTPVKV